MKQGNCSKEVRLRVTKTNSSLWMWC